jgi:integrase/recombinase XerD
MYSESLQKLLAEFVEAHRVRRMAQATIDGRRHATNVFFQYLAEAGVEDIRAVTRQHIRDYQSWLMRPGKYCVHTVHLHMIAIRRLFDHLENTDAILLNPCVGLRLPKLPDRLPRSVLTLSEVKAVLKQPDTQTPKGIRDRALLEMFYSTGLRVGEMAALTIHDVDPKNGFVRVNKGKGGKDRVVPMGWTACKYAREYLKEVRSKWTEASREERAFWLASVRPHRPIARQMMMVLVSDYGKAAGLTKRLVPHTWRHTCATHMIANGGSVHYVQRLLGHRCIETTEIYTRVAASDLKAAYRKAGPKTETTKAPLPVNARKLPPHQKNKLKTPVPIPEGADQ